MQRSIIVVMVALLAGCGSAVAPAASPPTPATVPVANDNFPATSPPTPTADRPLPLPAGWTQVSWEGLRISYSPSANPSFEVAAPRDGARAAALLVPSCRFGLDCYPPIALRIFASDGEEVAQWVDRNAAAGYHGRENITIDGVAAITYQVGYASDGLGAPTYFDVVPFGSDILQIERVQGFGEEIPVYLDLNPPPLEQMAAGQQVFAQQEQELWSAPVAGERVVERPRLYAGALVTLLQLTPTAVEVRTPEGVTGWIQQPAASVLWRDRPAAHALTGVVVGQPLTVISPKGLPLRDEPSSQASKLREQIPSGEQVTISAIRGDWLLVTLKDGAGGWIRWYYDGAQYMR